MPESGILVTPEAFGRMLSNLFLGRAVRVKKIAPMPLPLRGAFVLATYKSADGQDSVVCVCDLALASAAGAALSLIPASVAQESVRAGKLSETLAENIHEVFNVCSALLNQPNHPRFVLDKVVLPPVAPGSVPTGPMAKPLQRHDFEVSIDGYGAGKYSAYEITLA